MPDPREASWFVAQETRALLARLARVKPFVLHETMVPAAALLPASQIAIEQFLAQGRQELRERAHAFCAGSTRARVNKRRPLKLNAASRSCACASTICCPSSTRLPMC